MQGRVISGEVCKIKRSSDNCPDQAEVGTFEKILANLSRHFLLSPVDPGDEEGGQSDIYQPLNVVRVDQHADGHHLAKNTRVHSNELYYYCPTML